MEEMEEGVINHPGHNHPLWKLECTNDSLEGNRICSGCNRVLCEMGVLDVLCCQEEGCEYYLHLWCAQLGYMVDYDSDKVDHYYSDKIDHSLHPQHPLTLHFTTSYPPPLPPNNNNGFQTQTTDDHQYFVCSFCKQIRTSGFLLHCAPCDFYLDFCCAYEFALEFQKQLLSQYKFQNFFHENHTLLPHRYFYSSYSRPGSWFCLACGGRISHGDLVLKCSASECEDYHLHVGCFRVPEEMKHPFHPQHTLTLVQMSITQDGEEAVTSRKYLRPFSKDRLRCSACHKLIGKDAFVLNCNQCPLGSFALDMHCALLNPTVKYDRHDHHLLAHYKDIDIDEKDALCAACNTHCFRNLYRCFACNFNIHKACLSLPLNIADYDQHLHPFTLVNSLNEDQSGTYFYCDVCEEKREPNHGLYSCQECGPSFVAHFECLLPPSYTKGNKPWMRRNFIHENEDEELMPDELVSQLGKKIEKIRKIVKELLPEGVLGKNVTPELAELEESSAEAEDLIRQLRELIID